MKLKELPEFLEKFSQCKDQKLILKLYKNHQLLVKATQSSVQ